MMTEQQKKDILNRIDDPGGCRVVIEYSYAGVNEYCSNDEYHPFSGICEYHTPPEYPHDPFICPATIRDRRI